MSAAAMSRAALTVPVTCNRTAYRVLMLAAFAAETDETGQSRVELKRAWVAQVLGIAPRSVQHAVRELLAAGLLAEVAPPQMIEQDGWQRWQSTLYEVLPEGGQHGSANQ